MAKHDGFGIDPGRILADTFDAGLVELAVTAELRPIIAEDRPA
jgi:hypothetical protein